MLGLQRIGEVSVVGDGTWLRPGEVATMLGVHVNTVLSYVDSGLLDNPVPARKLPSGHRRIHKDSARRMQESLGNRPPAEQDPV